MKNIDIKGAIVSDDDKWIYEWLDISATSPKDVSDVLKNSSGEDIQLTINSGGGDAFAASEIYTELMDYDGNVESRIVGIAASAASVIAMAGRVKMSPTAQMMIHNAWTVSIGDRNEMQGVSNFLKSVDRSIATAYEKKTGMSEEELLSLMDKETWMDATTAKENGFADEVMFEMATASASVEGTLPQKVVDKIRNELKNKKPAASVQVDVPDELKDTIKSMQAEIKELKNEIKTSNQAPANKKPKRFL